MRWVVLFAFAMCFVLQSAIAQDVPAEGAVIKGNLVIGRSTFALPPGDWTVVATNSSAVTIDGQTRGAGVATVYMVQLTEDRVFKVSMSHRVPLTSTAVRTWNDTLCDRRDTLHRDTLSGRFDFPECLLINHSVPFWANAPTNEFDRRIWDWFQKNNVKLPVTALSATYRKYFAGDYVSVLVAVNPEVYGQEPSVKTAWTESEWHPLVIKNDPKRLAYVENFKKWAYVMAENAASTLRDRKPKAAALPVFDQ